MSSVRLTLPAQMPALVDAFEKAKAGTGRLHLWGLCAAATAPTLPPPLRVRTFLDAPMHELHRSRE